MKIILSSILATFLILSSAHATEIPGEPKLKNVAINTATKAELMDFLKDKDDDFALGFLTYEGYIQLFQHNIPALYDHMDVLRKGWGDANEEISNLKNYVEQLEEAVDFLGKKLENRRQ